MLTDPSPHPAARDRHRRRRAAAVAIVPTARVTHLGAAALTAILGGLPAAVVGVRGGTELAVPLVIAGLGTGAVLGWAVDDPASAMLTPLPVPASARTWLRIFWTAAAATGGLALLAVVLIAGPGLPPDWTDRFPEAAAAAACGLAVGLVAAHRDERPVGALGVAAGLLIPLCVASLATRWPGALPGFASGPLHARWWVLVGLAAALAAHAGRDPARPSRRSPRLARRARS